MMVSDSISQRGENLTGSPRVSVVMGAYNSEKYLHEAIDSILNQTFTDFEFIIVDDGSTDGTWKILDSYDDPRLIKLRQETNRGHAKALNWGIRISRGEYIARMDADDVSEPERFEKQVSYLDAHPETALLVPWIRLLRDDVLTEEIERPGFDRAVLAWQLSWKNPICHPAVMMRRSAVMRIGAYEESKRCNEDRHYWIRMVMAGEVITILPEVLHRYRIWSEQIGSKRYLAQREEGIKSAAMYLEWLLGRSVPEDQVEMMVSLYRPLALKQAEEIKIGMALAEEVIKRCVELFIDDGGAGIFNEASDALISVADYVLRRGWKLHARANILAALRLNPLRAARPWTFKLLAQTYLP